MDKSKDVTVDQGAHTPVTLILERDKFTAPIDLAIDVPKDSGLKVEGVLGNKVGANRGGAEKALDLTQLNVDATNAKPGTYDVKVTGTAAGLSNQTEVILHVTVKGK